MSTQGERGLALGLLLALLLAYLPALGGSFIWDDPEYVVDNPVLSESDGLLSIWSDVTATPQYYPLVHSSFWIERRLWGLSPFGYHLVNVLLHVLNAWLLWKLLQRLAVPGAWIAALLFAFHPVMVESVAWVTERKNVLSLAFYLGAFLVYWPLVARQEGAPEEGRAPPRALARTVAAFLLFVAALFSKSVTCSWPAAVLLLAWWKRGRVRARDAARLAPFFVVALAYAALTIHLEKTHVGAEGAAWELDFLERTVVAGRAVWFYLGKLILPVSLSFVYPRWEVADADPWQLLYPLAVLGLLAALFLARRRLGRGPLVAALFFVGTLFPALGFFDVYPMRFSFVADHFQYHASLGPLALAGAGLALGLARLPKNAAIASVPGLIALLAFLTFRQAQSYENIETLWQRTLERNARAWIAHQNLGALYVERGEEDRARHHYEQALAIEPDIPETLYNYSTLIAHLDGRREEAIAHLRRALELRPDHHPAAHNLGFYLLEENRPAEARRVFEQGLQGTPFDARLWLGIGLAYARESDLPTALEAFGKAQAADPAFHAPWLEQGKLLERAGRFADAAASFEAAAERAPEPGLRDSLRAHAADLRARE